MKQYHYMSIILLLCSGMVQLRSNEPDSSPNHNNSIENSRETIHSLLQIGFGFGFTMFHPAGSEMDSTGVTTSSLTDYLINRNSPIMIGHSDRKKGTETLRYRIQYTYNNQFRLFIRGYSGDEPGINRGTSFSRIGLIPGSPEPSFLTGRRVYRKDDQDIQGFSWIENYSDIFSVGLNVQREKRTLLSTSILKYGIYKRYANEAWLHPAIPIGDIEYRFDAIHPGLFFDINPTRVMKINYTLDLLNAKGNVRSRQAELGDKTSQYLLESPSINMNDPYSIAGAWFGSASITGLRHTLNLEFKLDPGSNFVFGYIYENALLSHDLVNGVALVDITGEPPVQFTWDRILSFQKYRMNSQEFYLLLEFDIGI